MVTLSQAPLIEAWLEVRWGQVKVDPATQEKEYSFPGEEIDFFFGQFKMIADSDGLSHVERVFPEFAPPIPHVVVFRFREGPNIWPCFQIGRGVFTVNQINDGYNWPKFKKDMLRGIEYLHKANPLKIEKLPIIDIQLRYRDGFLFKTSESPIDFLNKNMEMSFKLPPDLFNKDFIMSNPSNINLGFTLNTVVPVGSVIINLRKGAINAQPGFIMDTVTRITSDEIKKECADRLNLEYISSWLEEAHVIQQHCFNTLIDPAYKRSFE